jgi:hypothetical protein
MGLMLTKKGKQKLEMLAPQHFVGNTFSIKKNFLVIIKLVWFFSGRHSQPRLKQGRGCPKLT